VAGHVDLLKYGGSASGSCLLIHVHVFLCYLMSCLIHARPKRSSWGRAHSYILWVCRCPGRFLALAEVSLIALLLLGACKLELGHTEEVYDSVKQAELQSSACCNGRREACSTQQNCSIGIEHYIIDAGSAENSQVSRCSTPAADTTPEGFFKPDAGTSSKAPEGRASCAAGGSVLIDAESCVLVRKGCNPASADLGETGTSCSGVCRDRQDTPRHEHGRALPQPELRRQVGVRWPQHDLVVSVCALCASM
jgi:hypothetical protein